MSDMSTTAPVSQAHRARLKVYARLNMPDMSTTLAVSQLVTFPLNDPAR